MTGLGSVTEAVAADRTGPSAKSTLSREDFMRILLAEMSNQDPMNPVGNQEFLSQLSQLQTLEATAKLSDGIASLVSLQKLSAAGSLIGMNIRAVVGDGQELTGLVEKIVMHGDQIAVAVDGHEVGLEKIQEMWRDAP